MNFTEMNFTEVAGTNNLLDFEIDFCSSIFVPMIPICVLSTSFKTNKPVQEIVDDINALFTKFNIQFEFIRHTAEYSASYINGTEKTGFYVHIYNCSDPLMYLNDNCDKIIEVQRLKGDGFVFNSIYTEICNAVLGVPTNSSSKQFYRNMWSGTNDNEYNELDNEYNELVNEYNELDITDQTHSDSLIVKHDKLADKYNEYIKEQEIHLRNLKKKHNDLFGSKYNVNPDMYSL